MKMLLSDKHKQLGKFYAVDNYEDLVDIQSEHINKLQKKLPVLRDEMPRKVRA